MTCPAQLFASATAVVLDFDGPVTTLMPSPVDVEAADAARAALRAHGIVADPGVLITNDHLTVLRWTAANAPAALALVEATCDDAETAAALTARPTYGAHALLTGCYRQGKPVVIVSKNAAVAVRAYLDRWHLRPYVRAVVGRPKHRPDLMTLDAYTLRDVLWFAGAEPSHAVFVGDSAIDVEVARAAGVPCIGYAKTPARGEELRTAGADAVTGQIADLAATTATAQRFR